MKFTARGGIVMLRKISKHMHNNIVIMNGKTLTQIADDIIKYNYMIDERGTAKAPKEGKMSEAEWFDLTGSHLTETLRMKDLRFNPYDNYYVGYVGNGDYRLCVLKTYARYGDQLAYMTGLIHKLLASEDSQPPSDIIDELSKEILIRDLLAICYDTGFALMNDVSRHGYYTVERDDYLISIETIGGKEEEFRDIKIVGAYIFSQEAKKMISIKFSPQPDCSIDIISDYASPHIHIHTFSFDDPDILQRYQLTKLVYQLSDDDDD